MSLPVAAHDHRTAFVLAGARIDRLRPPVKSIHKDIEFMAHPNFVLFIPDQLRFDAFGMIDPNPAAQHP